MGKHLIGLDVGSHSLKIVEIIKKNKEIRLLSYGLKIIPKEASPEDYPILLQELCKESGISSGNRIKTSVSGKNVITRYAVFPYMTKTNLIHSLKFEYEKYIPFPLEECIVDIDILNKRPDGKMDVLIVSAKKVYIQKRINLIKEAGFLPQAINIDALALYKAFAESPFFTKKNSFIFLNVGHIVTNLLIVKEGEIIFSRDLNIGGENFNRSISDKMNVSRDKVEKIKQEIDESSLIDTLSVDLNSLISELELSIAYSKKNHSLENIEGVYISGGSAKLKGLNKMLEKSFNMQINLWNPFMKIKKPKDVSTLEENYLDLILSLGIALS